MSDQEMRKDFEDTEFMPPTGSDLESISVADSARSLNEDSLAGDKLVGSKASTGAEAPLVTDSSTKTESASGVEATALSESPAEPDTKLDSVFASENDLFRPSENPIPEAQMTPQMQSLAEERAALKAARAEALNPMRVASVTDIPEPDKAQSFKTDSTSTSNSAKTVAAEDEVKLDKNLGKKPNDRFLPSIGLFILRLVTAFIVGVNGINIVTDIQGASGFIGERLGLPEPEIIAWAFGVALLGIAVCLVFGLLTRIAGLLLSVASGLVLAFYYWGAWSIFIDGQPGFLGERELLLGTVGLLFLTVGAGGWSLDRSFRVGRARDKAERALAEADL